jgi:hypothetical protein
VAIHIDQVQTDLDIRPSQPGDGLRSGALVYRMSGVDRTMLDRLRPIVLLVLQEELERLRRQHR